MRKISLGVLVLGFVVALGLYATPAQAQPPMTGMAGMSGRCGAMTGPGMTGKPMTGQCGCGCGMMTGKGMMGPNKMRKPVMGRCGCGMMAGAGGCGMMTGKGMMGRHMGMAGGMGMTGTHNRILHYVMGLALDQKQKAEIWKIKTGMMKDMIRKKADLRISKLELGELLHADKVDMKKVEAKVKQMEGLRSAMLLSGIEALEAAKAKLTSEQRKELDDMMDRPGRCIMMGGAVTGGSMTDEDMMGETPSSPAESEMEERPAADN